MFKNLIRKFRRTSIAILLFLGLVVVWATIGSISRKLDFWDDDASRGAKVVGTAAGNEPFGPGVDKIVYLEQGWAPQDSLWFYNATEGSDLLPYSFFLHLEQADKRELFRSDANIVRYRYLPQRPTFSNPDGLPVGMARDAYLGKDYMGFTCAACHTTQINYKGLGLRIDGGPAMADMETFMVEMERAIKVTLDDPAKLKRFTDAVLKDGAYAKPEQVKADLETYRLALKSYVVINNPKGFTENDDGDGDAKSHRVVTHYGYARLDAFGRIFNRVLEHILGIEDMKRVLFDIMPYDKYTQLAADIDARFREGAGRDHVFQKVMQIIISKAYLSPKQIVLLRDKLFNPANAPVSYPFLWDIPQHDYVQWNGIVANAGLGPMGRNAGQVIGVFGTLDWQEKKGFNLESVLGGQGFGETHVDFKSSVNIRNLRRVEDQLRTLKSPKWPEAEFANAPDWKIDTEKAIRGEHLFNEYCASCHEQINRDSKDRRVVASMIGLDKIGTDRVMATNSVAHNGQSGILRHNYVDAGPGKILLRKEAPVAALLTLATRNVLTTPDPDKIFVQRWAERLFDYATTIFNNDVQASLKSGNYEPDTTAKPYASLTAYKGRSLNGIWATAPYLHNGSVPTLYHLLLPKKRPGDPEGPDYEYRPDTFKVGSREFDPKQVGFKWKDYDGFEFRTDISGNSNAGHEYAAGRTPQLDGRTLPALDKREREYLLEYLKTL